ncbi:sensor domain-containing diguanylate cyclase [Roseibium salinum]|uniref:Diguanylate cyclase n=1 Tax=Roseibium salinum TaxID=1604349 RepID=A0ABT3R344_9HYPH|nr:diguanylate cyclase [Roseibium sp. DSM 29163]MCX2723556.1 diguanylate cyclase [Roseibium sp. DSM 29163]
MAFVTFLSHSLDRNSIRSSEQIFTSMLGDRSEHLADITLEYGYWDIAVENLVDQVNMKWVEETFVDYMQEELQIEGIHLIDGNNQPKLHVVEGNVAEADIVSRYGDAVHQLIRGARETPRDRSPTPATGLIGTLDRLYLASAALMTTYEGDTDTNTDHVLIFARPMDEALLARLSEKYRLPDLRLSTSPPAFWQAGYPVETIDDRHVGYFIWNPELAGVKLLPLLGLCVLIVYASMFFSARLFFRRASEVVGALQEAKQQADKARELLASQARSDPLTGLWNRRYLDEVLARLETADEASGDYALLYADLDRFKVINDTFGHEAGDQVLQHVADCLRALVRAEDAIFRLGGDEFIIMFGNANRERVLAAARALIDRLSKPLNLDGAICDFGASVGISFSRDPSELLKQADEALYSAKNGGRGQLAVYSEDSRRRR